MDKAVYERIAQESDETMSQRKYCVRTGDGFPIFVRDEELLQQMASTIGSETFTFPIPDISFEMRQLNRMLFRNERTLYRRACDITGAILISMYSPEYTGKVCSQEYRRSDAMEALDFGRDYDFSTSFTDQFKELYDDVPKMATTIQESENCTYTNSTGDSKDCYMSFRCHYCTNALYSYRPNRSVDCIDCLQVKSCEQLFRCVDCVKCQRGSFLYHCNNCFNSDYLRDCDGCHDCFMCCNLANASYCIANKQYSKEAYEEIVRQFRSPTVHTLDSLWEKFEALQKRAIYSSVTHLQTEGCIGSGLVECSVCFMTFMMRGCTGCRRAWDNVGYNSCMDNYSGGDSELCYNTSAAKKCYRTHCCLRVRECEECLYSMFCFWCKHCFGCVGLRNKEYCIFNKQYSRNEYNELLPRIIKHMQQTGERGYFFDPSISAFPYNDTVASEYFPVKKTISVDGQIDEVEESGVGTMILEGEDFIVPACLNFGLKKVQSKWRTSASDVNIPAQADKIKSNELPQHISEVDDSITSKVIICSSSGRPYRIVATELAMYRTMGIPLPRLHPDLRHQARGEAEDKRKLFLRTCDKSGDDILSVHETEASYRVYKKELYGKIVYG